MLPHVGHFLVTLPIDLHAHARFCVAARDRELRVTPASKWKALRLASLLLTHRGLRVAGSLRIASAIPAGKGLASSTADLVATYRAIAACHGLQASVDELQALLREIEPSDGVMYAGVVTFRHRAIDLHAQLAPTPALTLIAIDEGGQVDTIEFNRQQLDYDATQQAHYAALLARLRQCLLIGNIAGVGAVSTRSAHLNQQRLPRKSFAQVVDIARSLDAAGVVATHSGPCLAVLLDGNDARHDEKQEKATAALAALGYPLRTYASLAGKRRHPSVRMELVEA
jgi:L-threonine kinase